MPWWEDYPSSGPIRVDGGLKARSARGAIAKTWWSRRFVEVIESMQLGGRMTRGRSYARGGQVLSLAVSAGKVVAKVQGSRPAPYEVKLIAKPLSRAQWDLVTDSLAEQAIFAAKLLAGRMPEEIEAVFTALDLPLFPTAARDMPMHCSCPDWAVPCKHVAAVCYLLAERFDEDPFLIFQWRGRTKDELLERLRAQRGSSTAADRPVEAVPPVFPGADLIVADAPPLGDLVDDFFSPGPLPGKIAEPDPFEPGLLLRQLDQPRIIVRGKPVTQVLVPLYRAMWEEDPD